MKAILFASLGLMLSAPMTHAQSIPVQPAPASCADLNAALPSIWAAWTQTAPLSASTTASNAAAVSPGRAYAVTLSPAAQVTPVSGRPGKDGTFAGLLGFDVTAAGTYTIALDQPAWVDMAGTGGMLRSSGHTHGIDCSSVRKTVDFQLEPGHYTLQISNAPQSALTLEVQPK